MELYSNSFNKGAFKYARAFEGPVSSKKIDFSSSSGEVTSVCITGIPDGVDPAANECLIRKGTKRRLYIFASQSLSEVDLKHLEDFYGKVPYPLFKGKPFSRLTSYPQDCNFFLLPSAPLSMTSQCVEYRLFALRSMKSNMVYNESQGLVYKVAFPFRSLLAIVMPRNFVCTNLKSGYFVFPENIIMRVYSKYILSGFKSDATNLNGLVSDITSVNARFRSVISRFFTNYGFHNIVDAERQIYAHDKYMTLVVGEISNIIMP